MGTSKDKNNKSGCNDPSSFSSPYSSCAHWFKIQDALQPEPGDVQAIAPISCNFDIETLRLLGFLVLFATEISMFQAKALDILVAFCLLFQSLIDKFSLDKQNIAEMNLFQNSRLSIHKINKSAS